jgi:hypothetical protein
MSAQGRIREFGSGSLRVPRDLTAAQKMNGCITS